MLKSLITGEDTETGEKTTVLLLGLEPRNLELLKERRPILVKARDLNARMVGEEREDFNLPDELEVLIFYGDTKEEMMAQITEHTTTEARHR